MPRFLYETLLYGIMVDILKKTSSTLGMIPCRLVASRFSAGLPHRRNWTFN